MLDDVLSKLGSYVGLSDRGSASPVRLVVAMNAVDKIGPGEWNTNTACPTKEQEDTIDRRCEDIAKKLSRETGLRKEQITYYSAKWRYRLYDLLVSMIRACLRGWVFPVMPKSWVELASPKVQELYRIKMEQEPKDAVVPHDYMEWMMREMSKKVSPKEFQEFKKKYDAERAKPAKVAIFGQAGVGKTTTVNALFNADFKTSHTIQGTYEAQTYKVDVKEFGLESGGTLEIVDLPGYGVSRKDDERYYPIYKAVLPQTDVILLIMQANDRSMAEDQLMISNLITWLNEINSSKK